jgi:hypothetical protein
VKQIRKRLTYANVVSSICLFLLLGGATALAAGQLGKNTVGSKQLKKNAVTAAKIKKNAVTEAKVASNAVTGAKIKDGAVTTTKIGPDAVTGAQVNEATLGTVPSAATANLANSIPPAEPTHVVGAPGEPGFENGSSNLATEGLFNLTPVGFYKDHDGIVHLTGIAQVGNSSTLPSIFTLPPGFRPAAGTVAIFSLIPEGPAIIGGTGASFGGLDLSGKVAGNQEKPSELEGITFRAGS